MGWFVSAMFSVGEFRLFGEVVFDVSLKVGIRLRILLELAGDGVSVKVIGFVVGELEVAGDLTSHVV